MFSKSVKGLSENEKTWVLLDQDFKEVKASNNKVSYLYKSCIDKFTYKIEHEGKNVNIKLTEKRLLTYNPTLAAKKRYEINRMVEKAKSLTVSKAKRADYGETSSSFINDLSEMLGLPLTNYFLSETQIKSILNHKF